MHRPRVRRSGGHRHRSGLCQFGPADLTVVDMPGEAPEDVVVDADGFLWTGLADGRVVRIDPDGATRVVADTGAARSACRWPATAGC